MRFSGKCVMKRGEGSSLPPPIPMCLLNTHKTKPQKKQAEMVDEFGRTRVVSKQSQEYEVRTASFHDHFSARFTHASYHLCHTHIQTQTHARTHTHRRTRRSAMPSGDTRPSLARGRPSTGTGCPPMPRRRRRRRRRAMVPGARRGQGAESGRGRGERRRRRRGSGRGRRSASGGGSEVGGGVGCVCTCGDGAVTVMI